MNLGSGLDFPTTIAEILEQILKEAQADVVGILLRFLPRSKRLSGRNPRDAGKES